MIAPFDGAVTIVVDEAQNALVVPTRAIKTVNRQKIVIALRNGQQAPTPVETGLSANSMTEIISGLQEGDQVLVTSTGATSTAQMGGGFGGPGEMGGGGMPPMDGGGPGGPPPGGN